MALWALSQNIRQVQGLYGNQFPIEVRHFLAHWIEEQKWFEIEEDNPASEDRASSLLSEMIQIIQQRAQGLTNEDMFLTKLKLQEHSIQMQDLYGRNPIELVRVVKHCLCTEQTLVEQGENNVICPMTSQPDKQREITAQFELLQHCTQETDADLQNLQQKQETFIIQYQDSVRLKAQIDQLEPQVSSNAQKRTQCNQVKERKDTVDGQLRRLAEEILQLRLSLAEKHRETFQNLSTLQTGVLDQVLIDWKRKQQLAGNGLIFDASLETLQKWCETLADIISRNRQQIKKVELLRAQLPIEVPPPHIDLLPTLNTTITGLLSSLVTSTFIIEKQPPQVLKKEARFSATVRLLVGGQLNVHINPPQVKATLISEGQAKSLLKNDKNLKSESSGDILNNQGTMEFHQPTGTLSVTFRNMQLKRVKRGDRRGTESVMEEKFSILFQSNFSVGGGELVFQVWTLSLPVVVTVHGNQECNALATVLWDNQFAESGRVPFEVPDAVTWPQLAEMLNCKFNASTGRLLTQDNLNYMASKLFNGPPNQNYSNSKVSWTQFYKDTLPGRNFTFWEWFYAILKLTKEHLRGPWCDGFIIGFISKNETEEVLRRQSNGTFLLRYSDSVLGGITIGWVDETSGSRQVWNLAPFSSKAFAIRSLADRVKDIPNLICLYPTLKHKSDTFGRYWTQNDESTARVKDGYIGTVLVTKLPVSMGMPTDAQMLTYDNPQTPSAESPYDVVHSPNPSLTSGAAGEDFTDMASLDNFMDYNADDIGDLTGDITEENIAKLLGAFSKPSNQ